MLICFIFGGDTFKKEFLFYNNVNYFNGQV